LEIGAPIYAPTEGTREERMTAMAQAWVKCFETRLRADPSQWAAFYHVWNTPSTLERQSQSLLLEKINVVASTTDDKVGFFEE
jgi:lauroyl/myristoyl acyltransferase